MEDRELSSSYYKVMNLKKTNSTITSTVNIELNKKETLSKNAMMFATLQLDILISCYFS